MNAASLSAALNAGADGPRITVDVPRGGRFIALNADAYEAMHCESDMTILQVAGHLFEEPGALDQVFAPASAWSRGHLGDMR
ncbi:hypothetical protein [Novosphingobium album (ex Hu et al. 2023)]|uniref:Uncharacterized protein n=1 Tax=Novosphingobium album (ex Hu et al. 2023) TaxID=2930093 RepID=A0ABT0B6L4_9SPHN|nr:hypothetical protein [Novosphingobium album (ex Hu et al. 2023)]MCJ2180717.1 hypothetical protein [Novosphingobium album (ex Hu et al. 2023)]